MLKTILVPLDGSALAERALSLATALSIPTGAHLVLVRVFAGEKPADFGAPYGTYLEKTAADLRERGFQAETVDKHGKRVAEAITSAADEHGADLIVMTTHGHAGPARWVLGSVAEDLVKCSRVPVLLQRAWDPGRRALLLDDQPLVLTAVDGSRFSESALPAACALAEDLGAKLMLVRVMPGSDDVAVREYLEALAARLRAEWPSLTIETRVDYGDPAIAIVAATGDAGAALVVMATHGRTGLERVALGSVADGVLHRGRAPLVLVHPAPVVSGEASILR
jgi:nucleotide-binding universal stress UspA family protein